MRTLANVGGYRNTRGFTALLQSTATPTTTPSTSEASSVPVTGKLLFIFVFMLNFYFTTF